VLSYVAAQQFASMPGTVLAAINASISKQINFHDQDYHSSLIEKGPGPIIIGYLLQRIWQIFLGGVLGVEI
jgi:hypothetical protein